MGDDTTNTVKAGQGQADLGCVARGSVMDMPNRVVVGGGGLMHWAGQNLSSVWIDEATSVDWEAHKRYAAAQDQISTAQRKQQAMAEEHLRQYNLAKEMIYNPAHIEDKPRQPFYGRSILDEISDLRGRLNASIRATDPPIGDPRWLYERKIEWSSELRPGTCNSDINAIRPASGRETLVERGFVTFAEANALPLYERGALAAVLTSDFGVYKDRSRQGWVIPHEF